MSTFERWTRGQRSSRSRSPTLERFVSHFPAPSPFPSGLTNPIFFSVLGYHTSTCADDKLIVLGGSDGSQSFSSIDVLDLKTNVWHRLDRTLDNSPVSRAFHSTVLVGDSLFAVGGHDGKSYAKDILAFDFRPFSVSFLLLCAGRSG